MSQANTDRPRARSFRETLDDWCEGAIVCVVLAILVVGPLCFGAVRSNQFSGSAHHFYGLLSIYALTVLALALWGMRFFTQRRFRLLWPPACWAVFAFVLYAIVRCQTSEFAYLSRQDLQLVVLYAALFFLIVNNLNRRESATLVAVVLISLGMAESLFAIYQAATHHRQVWDMFKPAMYAGRGSGTYIDPDDYAGFIGMILPLALACTVMGRFNAVVKVLLGYCALVMITGMILSESRGGLVAMGLMLLAFCIVLLFQRDYWRHGLAAMIILTVTGLILLHQLGGVLDRIMDLPFNRDEGRYWYWRTAWGIFKSHILWGAGPGAFPHLYPLSAYKTVQTNPVYAHNDYLNTLCEWGLVGFALVISTLGLLLAGVFRTWPYVTRGSNEMGGKRSSRAAFVLGAALGLFVLALHSTLDFNMQIPANAILAITLMALLTAHWRFATERYWLNPGTTGRILLLAVVCGAIYFIANEGLRSGHEFRLMVTALKDQTPWEQRISKLEAAQKIEPLDSYTDYLLGEDYRLKAWEGAPGNELLALKGMQWLARGMVINPYDAQLWRAYGQSLDWLGRTNEASRYYVHGLGLSPSNVRMQAEFAYHCFWVHNYSMADWWLRLSIEYYPDDDALALLKEVREKEAEEAKTNLKTR